MQIDQLKSLITGNITNAELHLEPSQLGSEAVSQMAATFLPDQIVIKEIRSIDEAGDGIKVIGHGVGFPFDGMDVEATFNLQNQDAAVVIRATPPDHWRFDSLFPQLSNSIFTQLNFADPHFCLASHAVSEKEGRGLTFSGMPRLMPSLRDLDFLFAGTGVEVRGPIELEQGAPRMKLEAELVSDVGLGFLNLPVKPHLCSVPVYNSVDKKTHADAFLLFDTNITFNTKGHTYQIPLAAQIYSPQTNILFNANFTQAVDAAVSELSGLLNGANLGAILPENFHIEDAVTLTDLVIQVNPSAQDKVRFVTTGAQTTKSWSLVDGLTLESIKLFFKVDDPGKTKELSFGVTSELRLGDAVLEFSAFSDLSFSGGLKEGSTLKVNELCKHFGLDDPHIPELEVDELEFSIEPKDETYSFRAFIPSEWNIGIDDFELTLEDVLLAAEHSSPDVTDLEFQARMGIGGVTFDVKVSRPSAAAGLSLSGRTDEGETVNLTNLIGDIFELFDFDVPENLPDISIKNVSISYNFTTQEFAFRAENEVASSLKLGNTTHQVDTSLDLTITKDPTTNQRTYSGRLLGSVTFGSAVFQGEYDFADAKLLKATWDGKTGSLDFSDLAASHGIIHDLPIPDVSLELTAAAFEFDLKKSQFRLSADSAHGEAFFIASNANQTWDFAFGILMDLSNISGLPDFGLSLKNTMLILSSVADDNFKVPSLPGVPIAANQPAEKRTFPAIGTTKMRLRRGVTVAAVLDLKDDKILSNLGLVLKKDELLIQVVIGSGMSSVSFLSYLDGSLTLDMGGEKLVLSDPYVRVDPMPEPGFFVAGTTLIPFNHLTLRATGALHMGVDDMTAQLQLKAEADGKPQSIPTPFGLRGVSLDELDIEVGVVFEPPGILFGIEGKFHIKGQTSNANNFIIVLDPKTGIPNPIYLSMYAQELTISNLITAVSGEDVSGDIPGFIKSIKGTDLSVYWSESEGIALPDGRLAQAGFGFNGFISIGGFSMHAALTVSETTGISGDAELPPIDLGGVFSLKGNGQGVKVNQVQINDQWHTITKPPETEEEKKRPTREYQLIPAGGATIILNTKHSPYIDVSASVSLFNLLNAEVEIEVSNHGFKWKQKESIGSLFKTEFDCELSTKGFSANAEFDIDIKGDVGPITILDVDMGSIDLDVSFDAAFGICANEKGVAVTISGSFHFEGFHLTMPDISTSDFESFEELPEMILKQIQDNADDIFEDLFNDAGALLKAGVEKAKQIGEAAAKEAEQIGKEAAEQAEQLGADAKAAYDRAASDLKAATAEAEKLGKEAMEIIASVDGKVADITNEAAADVREAEGKAEQAAIDAANEVANIGAATEKEAEQIAKDAEKAFTDAADEAKRIGEDAEKAAQATLDAAENTGRFMVSMANIAASAMADEAERIGDEIADKAEEAWDDFTSLF